MRTHADVIRDAGGALKIHDRLGLVRKLRTVRSWATRDSIPSHYWRPLADQGLATVDELATYAALAKTGARQERAA
jgi:hypothetical protein